MDPNANPPAVPQPGIGEAPIDPGASESHQYYTEKDFEGNASRIVHSVYLLTPYSWNLYPIN